MWNNAFTCENLKHLHMWNFTYLWLDNVNMMLGSSLKFGCGTVWAFLYLCSLQAYTARNLKGLTVEHSSEMIKASDKILTCCMHVCGLTRLTRILNFLGRQKSCVDIKRFRFVGFIYFYAVLCAVTACVQTSCYKCQISSQAVECSYCLFL